MDLSRIVLPEGINPKNTKEYFAFITQQIESIKGKDNYNKNTPLNISKNLVKQIELVHNLDCAPDIRILYITDGAGVSDNPESLYGITSVLEDAEMRIEYNTSNTVSIYIDKNKFIGNYRLTKVNDYYYTVSSENDNRSIEILLNTIDNNTNEKIDKIESEVLKMTNLSNGNIIINGDFDIWQRGVEPFTISTPVYHSCKYTCDRWCLDDGIVSKSELLGHNAVKIAQLSNEYEMNFQQFVESVYKYKGKTLTLSYQARSNKTVNISTLMYTYTKDGTGISLYEGTERYIANTTQKHTITFTVPMDIDVASDRSLGIRILRKSDSTTGQEVIITDVKLEIGEIATPFVPRPYGEELLLCQRYYELVNRCFRACGVVNKDRLLVINYPFLIQKRVRPTVTAPSNLTDSLELTYIKSITPISLEVADVSLTGLRLKADLGETGTGYLGQTVECLLEIPIDSEIYQ